MKIYPKKIELSLKNIAAGAIKAALIYGPDQGMISTIFRKISSIINGDILNINFNEINSLKLKNHLQAQNLFGKREIIKISGCTAALHEEAKNALLEQYNNFPIFIAEELAPASSLRKFFENEQSLISIACYVEEDLDLKSTILQILSKSGKIISAEALNYLIVNLKGDQYLINQELNKLCIYANNQDEINLNQVENVISLGMETSADLLCYYFANNNIEDFFRELDKLYNDNISPIWILRALSRFYSNLYMVKLSTIENTALDTALKLAKPPIFFKYLLDFKKLVSKLDINQITRILNSLYEAESDSKKTGSYPENICVELFFKVHKEDIYSLEG